jgi:hypothetical protein
MRTNQQTDRHMTNLIVACRNLENASKTVDSTPVSIVIMEKSYVYITCVLLVVLCCDFRYDLVELCSRPPTSN